MTKISNSFHSSSKKNAVNDLSKLKECQRHNEREYLSEHYNGNRIEVVIGTNDLYKDTVDYIDNRFKKSIEDYNNKQKRNDRKINVLASEYFDSRKDTDIANEVIFQFADYGWWSQFRKEHKLKNGQKYMDFDEEVKQVARDIFAEQVQAYQDIYKNHGTEIIEKIKERENECQEIIQNTKPYYIKIVEEKDRSKKKNMIDFLRDDERKEFNKYTKALHDIETIKKKALLRTDEVGNYELLKSTIKVTNQTNHFDEHSIHAHVISVCTTPTIRGLNESISKSRVLNAWTLSALQDEMRVVLEKHMEQHPKIFENVELREKALGRNFDMVKDIYVAKQVEERQQRLESLERDEKLMQKHVESLHSEFNDVANDLTNMDYEYNELIRIRASRDSLAADIDELSKFKFEMNDLIEPSKEELPAYTLEKHKFGYVKLDDVMRYIEPARSIYDQNVELKAKLEASEQRNSYLQEKVSKFLKEPVYALNEALEKQIKELKRDVDKFKSNAAYWYAEHNKQKELVDDQIDRVEEMTNSLTWYKNFYKQFIKGVRSLSENTFAIVLSWFDSDNQKEINNDIREYERKLKKIK